MLVELLVENYAVIERARIRFHRGLNLLTGETGSGKSIVVDALGLLFGGRASAESVRSGADRARISGLFEIPEEPGIRRLLEEAGLEPEDGELLLEREILSSGKSRAFAASKPVTVALLRDLAVFLGDIHGQHDQQLLFSPEAQLNIVDQAADNAGLVARTAAVYREWRTCARELAELERSGQERLRLTDLWNFQRREIEAAAVRPGEDAELEQERRVLQNVGRLQENVTIAYSLLYDSPDSAAAQLKQAARRLEELHRIDQTFGELLEALKPAAIALEETSHTLRGYLSHLEADPARLEQVESRLALLEGLKRKYGSTLEEVLAFLETVRGHLDAVEHSGERAEAIRVKQQERACAYEQLARQLSDSRKRAARTLERQVEAELKSLAMERTVFRVQFEQTSWAETGTDRAGFLVSPNVGEEPKPLDKIASGGEISRIALALKTCIAPSVHANGPQRTLVFDEVDAGVGGRAAETVGRRLKRIAAQNQVLCVTHLPQIASFADHHYVVEKREVKGRTVAEIEEITADARTREIGRMLSGERLTPEALKHAEQLIRLGAEK
ncbi:MAG TPA: DNA repair protein RecN [Bryobacteraceae bacterium]|nr:DNA repair protein RecN [Bryobacteraceae bacterium]